MDNRIKVYRIVSQFREANMTGLCLKNLFQKNEPIISPGCYDALSALLIQQEQFQCASISGAAVTASLLGLPDYGFFGLQEMFNVVAQITSVCDLPVLVDCDSGYGNVQTAFRTMQMMIKAGAACVCFQDLQKSDEHLMTSNEMCGYIEAAKDARSNADTLLMVRTDACRILGIEEAIRRAKIYEQMGADLLFIDGVADSEMELVQKARFTVPLKYNNTIKDGAFQYSAQELYQRGFQLITYSASLQKAAIKAMQGILSELQRTGRTIGWIERKATQKERTVLLQGEIWASRYDTYGKRG